MATHLLLFSGYMVTGLVNLNLKIYWLNIPDLGVKMAAIRRGLGLPTANREGAIKNVLTLHPPITLELVVAVQRMATQFYGQDCSQIALLAVQMPEAVILACAPSKVPPRRRYFLSLGF